MNVPASHSRQQRFARAPWRLGSYSVGIAAPKHWRQPLQNLRRRPYRCDGVTIGARLRFVPSAFLELRTQVPQKSCFFDLRMA